MKLLVLLLSTAVGAWAQSEFSPPRLTDGHPDFRGIWMAASLSAAFNVEEHGASYGTPAGPSVIIDPPDRKLPYLPGMRERALDNDKHRERDPVAHCHMHGVPRVMFPPFPLEIVQDGNYVVILSETEHGVRIIPTDGRPFLKDYSSWNGDSRGRWEGDTLVVETTNFSDKNSFRGSSPNMKLTERFRRADANTLIYQFTVNDPETWEIPWTVEIPVTKSQGQLFEYACHEGNYGMAGALAGARTEEKAEQAKRGSK